MNSELSHTPAGGASPPLHPRRRDNLPPWVIVLLVLFLVVRVYDVGIAPFLHHPNASKPAAQSKDGSTDDDSVQDLIQTDLQAKSAFAQTFSKPGTVVKPDADALRSALTSAESLERESGNSPGAARRVILLRALLNSAAPGKAVLPPLAADKKGLAPLDAFGSALPPDLPAPDRARYAAEGRLWQTVFQGGGLSPRQIAQAAAEIRALPNIRWWQNPAMIALYTQQGDLAEAGRYGRAARDSALPALLPVGLLGLIRLGFILLGIALLIYFAVRQVQMRRSAARSEDFTVSAQGRASTVPLPPPGGWPPAPADTFPVHAAPLPAPGASPLPNIWPTVPDAIAPAQRRLGAGDLMGVFVVYLLTREVIGTLLTGFSGFDVPYLREFHGLLAPFRPALDRMSATQRTTTGIALESAVYLLSAVPPIIMLWTLARQRGASLADEIGWTRRRLGQNLLYGAGGFGIASALMIPVILIGRVVFRHAPDPSNPAISQLVGTSGLWGPLMLVALASLAAPVVEELLFRGVFYPAAKLRLGVWPAIVLTGFVFGIVHPVGLAEMLAIGTLGGVFAWMAETRKSLAPSMFAHFLQNFTTTLLLLSVLSG